MEAIRAGTDTSSQANELGETHRGLVAKSNGTAVDLTDRDQQNVQDSVEAVARPKQDSTVSEDQVEAQATTTQQNLEIEGRDKEEKPQQKSTAWKVLGCFLLLLAILGGGFIGPSSNMLTSEVSLIKTQWAFTLRFFYCIPLAAGEAFFTKDYKKVLKGAMNRKVVIGTLITPALQLCWNFGLVYGSDNLIQSHSYVCNTMFCIFIVLIGYCLCLKPYKLELIGLVITIGGVASMFSDPDAERADGKTGEFLTYAICIFCAFLASFFFLINGLLTKIVPVFLLLLSQALLGSIYMTVFLSIVYPDDYSQSTDQIYGAFGFLHKEEAFAAIVCYGLSAGFFGNAGYVICLLFFSPVIVSASFLLEPIVGQLIGYWMDIDHMPGWATWLGTFLVFVGIFLIQKADRQRRNDTKKQQAEVAANAKVAPESACKDEEQDGAAQVQKEGPESENAGKTAALRKQFQLSRKTINLDQPVVN